MGTIKGQNLRVFTDWNALTPNPTAIFEAMSCDITINNETEDSSTKDDTSDFARPSYKKSSWQLAVTSKDVAIPNLRALIGLMQEKKKFTVKWDTTTGAYNRQGENNQRLGRQGRAYLTDFSLQTPNREDCTVTLQFTGTGKLILLDPNS